MGNIKAGLYLLAALIVIQFVAALFSGFTTSTSTINAGCQQGDNATMCQNASASNFLERALEISVEGFEGAPQWINDTWTLLGLLTLAAGITLLAAGIIGMVFGSG